jgi:hypothetical protein
VIPSVVVIALTDAVILYRWADAPGVVRVSAVLLGVILLVVAAHATVERVDVAPEHIRVRDLRGVRSFTSGDATWDTNKVEFGVARK